MSLIEHYYCYYYCEYYCYYYYYYYSHCYCYFVYLEDFGLVRFGLLLTCFLLLFLFLRR